MKIQSDDKGIKKIVSCVFLVERFGIYTIQKIMISRLSTHRFIKCPFCCLIYQTYRRRSQLLTVMCLAMDLLDA